LAITAYFATDLWDMVSGVVRARKASATLRSACRPTHRGVDSDDRSWHRRQRYDQPEFHTLTVVTWTTIGYGLLLLLFDRMSMTVKRIEHATYLDAALVGISQVLALIPGTSPCRHRHDAGALSRL